MSKHCFELEAILKVTNSSTLEEALERAIVTAKTSDGRADLASKDMVNLVLELCRAFDFSTKSSQLLLCLKLLRNLCAGELRNQNSFLEHNGIGAVSSVLSCGEFVWDVEMIRICLQLLGNVALAGRDHQCAVWREFFPVRFSKIAGLRSWEVCDPLCMVIYTCACGAGADDLIAELCSDHGLPLIIEIVRTASKAGFREEWVKLLLSRVCLDDALFFESLFSTLMVKNFMTEQAFLLGIVSETLNNTEQTNDIVVSKEFTLFILKLLNKGIETVCLDTRGTSSLPTGIAITDIVGYSLTILRDVCASVVSVSDDVVRVLVSSGIIELLLGILKDLEPPSILRRAVIEDDTKKKCPYKGFRRDIVSILGNCAYRRKYVQDEIRERDGVLIVLQQCVVDDNNPFLREWGMFSVRNLMEGNEENQKVVEDLKIQGSVDVLPEMESLGLRVDIDPVSNRPKLVNV